MKLKNFFSVKFLPQISPQIYVSGEEEKEKKKWKSRETFPFIIGSINPRSFDGVCIPHLASSQKIKLTSI